MSPSSRRRSRSLVASSSRVWLASLRAVRSLGAGHRLDQVLPPLAHPVGRLPALVKLVQHLGEGSLGRLSISGPYWRMGRTVKSTGLPSRTSR
mgnify:CR=1 FL=1